MDRLLDTIRKERELLQENISMRVKYGWVLVTTIAVFLTTVTIPS